MPQPDDYCYREQIVSDSVGLQNNVHRENVVQRCLIRPVERFIGPKWTQTYFGAIHVSH